MSAALSKVRARIGSEVKARAVEVLRARGLTAADAVRILFERIAEDGRVPFEWKLPNATTREAIAELDAGKGKRFASVADLMADLEADD
jgi:DNA-damage-inducible protein J